MNKVPKGLWQITWPLTIAFIFAMGCVTTIYMTNGHYLFDAQINRDGVKIQTEMDKNRDSRAE